ncbi:MAG TPA: SDR family NAD(P)-dependent oxidoreductase [Dehalococcoidia bacterium]|nr:SDR family NAD(P)-dependent oxidoreductase [Dehalococcoidia bacterium]
MKPLTGQIALVTGAAKGIGRGIALCLAEDGAAVIVLDRLREEAEETVRLVERRGAAGLAIEADVTDRSDLESVLEQATSRFGRVDILVNNAGVGGAPGWATGEASPEDDWRVTFEVNVMGLVHCVEVFAPPMIARKAGRIINIASIAGKRGAPLIPFYSASKAAVINYTQSKALELARHNITVNAVCPGHLWTDMWDELAGRIAARNPAMAEISHREIFLAMVQRMTPTKREQSPEDIGYLVAFLASTRARNITGQAIDVDAGARLM